MDKLLKSFVDEMTSPQINKIEDDNLLNILCGASSAGNNFLKVLCELNKGIVGLSNYFFARKACNFLYNISDINPEKRYKFVGEIAVRGKDNAGSIFMSLLERLDNINKVEIFSNLFRACVLEYINVDNLFRATAILERIPYIDLNKLCNYQNPYFDVDSTAILFSSGAITLRTIAEKDLEDDQYVLTNAGYILVKYGLQIEILKPSISKIDIKGMLTAEIVDDKFSFEELD